MKHRRHLAVRLGDHSGQPPRDIAPGREPLTVFTEDGAVWLVVDIEKRIVRGFRKIARRERVSLNCLISAALVTGLENWLEARGWTP